jgi:uncharacterized membrane protein YuzA (DUF378 family)
MKGIDMISIILIIVGGLNWGLVGIFSFDLVAAIFGNMSFISRIVYILVAASALYQIFQWKAMQGRWGMHKAAA